MAIHQPSTLPAKSTEPLGDPGRLDAITLLLHDHRAVQQAMNDFQRCRDLEQRSEIIRDVIADVQEHERVEEQVFWPHVRQALPQGERLASARTIEEAQAQRLAEQVLRMEPTDPSWTQTVRRFMAAVLDHAGQEQLQVFQPLRAAVSVDELMAWGEEIERARD